jgi:hypothetical protein
VTDDKRFISNVSRLLVVLRAVFVALGPFVDCDKYNLGGEGGGVSGTKAHACYP